MSQLADKYYQVDGDGNVNVFDKGMFTEDLATMHPQTRSDLIAYQDLQRLRSILVKDLVSTIVPLKPAPTTTAASTQTGSGGYVWKRDANNQMVKAPIQ